ncbi:equatorin, sperm acrosome associated [Chelydra serpentina]|uniref:Equatorin, sperm acrosome associated n=1 Tax=Chelydra serpentina TaxID=8475 RepID=A0A8T1SK15_CHESE|nr:equatorin, sperm acrosome associated [Chelydra serpentina]
MNPILFLFLSLLISAGTTKKLISSSKDYHNLPVNDLEEEEEEDDNDGNNYVIQSPEDHETFSETDISTNPPVSKDVLMLKNSMQNLREYLKLLSIKKAEEEQLESFEAESSEESKFGPHYLNIITQGPVEESLTGDLRAKAVDIYKDPILKDLSAELDNQTPEFNETEYHPRNMFFKPVPMSDKGDLIQKKAANVGRKKDVRETLMLAVSSTTLIILIIFMICCGVTLNQFSKQKKGSSNASTTHSEQQRLAYLSYFQPLEGVSDSSFSKTADSSSMWDEKTASAIRSNSQSRHSKTRTLSNIKSVDDVSSISDESTRSAATSYKASKPGENEL